MTIGLIEIAELGWHPWRMMSFTSINRRRRHWSGAFHV